MRRRRDSRCRRRDRIAAGAAGRHGGLAVGDPLRPGRGSRVVDDVVAEDRAAVPARERPGQQGDTTTGRPAAAGTAGPGGAARPRARPRPGRAEHDPGLQPPSTCSRESSRSSSTIAASADDGSERPGDAPAAAQRPTSTADGQGRAAHHQQGDQHVERHAYRLGLTRQARSRAPCRSRAPRRWRRAPSLASASVRVRSSAPNARRRPTDTARRRSARSRKTSNTSTRAAAARRPRGRWRRARPPARRARRRPRRPAGRAGRPRRAAARRATAPPPRCASRSTSATATGPSRSKRAATLGWSSPSSPTTRSPTSTLAARPGVRCGAVSASTRHSTPRRSSTAPSTPFATSTSASCPLPARTRRRGGRRARARRPTARRELPVVAGADVVRHLEQRDVLAADVPVAAHRAQQAGHDRRADDGVVGRQGSTSATTGRRGSSGESPSRSTSSAGTRVTVIASCRPAPASASSTRRRSACSRVRPPLVAGRGRVAGMLVEPVDAPDLLHEVDLAGHVERAPGRHRRRVPAVDRLRREAQAVEDVVRLDGGTATPQHLLDPGVAQHDRSRSGRGRRRPAAGDGAGVREVDRAGSAA